MNIFHFKDKALCGTFMRGIGRVGKVLMEAFRDKQVPIQTLLAVMPVHHCPALNKDSKDEIKTLSDYLTPSLKVLQFQTPQLCIRDHLALTQLI